MIGRNQMFEGRNSFVGAVCLVVATMVSVLVLETRALRQQTGRALLAGQVVEATTARPLAGVVVTLGGSPSVSGSVVVLPFVQAAIPGGNRQTVTNEQGHFLFAGLPAGSYSVQAERAGFIPGGYGKAGARGLPQTIALGDTDRTTDLRISLSRFATISGRVFDEAGEPVIGVTVLAMRRVFERGMPQFNTAAAGVSDETDDRGVYRLPTLIPGDYILSIRSTQATVPMSVVEASRRAAAAGAGADFSRELRASGSQSFTGMPVGNYYFQSDAFGFRAVTQPPPDVDGTLFVYPTQFFPSAHSPSEATIVTVRSGETRSAIDFHLRPVPTSSVSGVVIGPAGLMSNLGLGLLQASNTSLAAPTSFEAATTVSDSEGKFTFHGVPVGQYVLRATKIPVAPATPSEPPAAGGVTRRTFQIVDGPTLWASLPIAVNRTSLSGLTVPLRRGYRVSGQIAFEGAAPKPGVLDALRGSVGRFEPLDDRIRSSTGVSDLLRIANDPEGRLKSYELPPGQYYLTLYSPPGWTLKSAMLSGRDVSVVPFDLQSDIASLAVTYSDRTSILRGTVRSPKGIPDGSAEVLVFPEEAVASTYSGSMRKFRAARANAQGTYDFQGLSAGNYFAVAVAAETAEDFPSLTLVRALAAVATRVTMEHGLSKTLDLATVAIR
jgi:hypothetical protein